MYPENTIEDYATGNRVELHPALDAWMMGDRYGNVVKVGRKNVHVLLDRSGLVRSIRPNDLRVVWS